MSHSHRDLLRAWCSSASRCETRCQWPLPWLLSVLSRSLHKKNWRKCNLKKCNLKWGTRTCQYRQKRWNKEHGKWNCIGTIQLLIKTLTALLRMNDQHVVVLVQHPAQPPERSVQWNLLELGVDNLGNWRLRLDLLREDPRNEVAQSYHPHNDAKKKQFWEKQKRVASQCQRLELSTRRLPPNQVLLNSVPNTGPLISRWELKL